MASAAVPASTAKITAAPRRMDIARLLSGRSPRSYRISGPISAAVPQPVRVDRGRDRCYSERGYMSSTPAARPDRQPERSGITVVPSGNALGAEIRGVDLTSLTDDDFALLHRAWLD